MQVSRSLVFPKPWVVYLRVILSHKEFPLNQQNSQGQGTRDLPWHYCSSSCLTEGQQEQIRPFHKHNFRATATAGADNGFFAEGGLSLHCEVHVENILESKKVGDSGKKPGTAHPHNLCPYLRGWADVT